MKGSGEKTCTVGGGSTVSLIGSGAWGVHVLNGLRGKGGEWDEWRGLENLDVMHPLPKSSRSWKMEVWPSSGRRVSGPLFRRDMTALSGIIASCWEGGGIEG
jgi:hypothetical protein